MGFYLGLKRRFGPP